MGLIRNILDRRGRKVEVINLSPAVTRINGMEPDELYEKQPALRAVVDFIARNIAQLPLKCYLRDGNDRVRDTEGVAPRLLARPNSAMTTFELVERLVIDLKLHGWALWYVVPSAVSETGWEIVPIPVAWVRSTPTVDGFEPYCYKIKNPNLRAVEETELPAADCVRFAMYSPGNPASATSPVDALKDVLAEQISAWEFRNQVWERGGRVQSYLYRPAGSPWTDAAFDRFKKQWDEYRGKGAGSGKTPILEDGMEIRDSTFNAREAEWVSATQLSRQDVAGVYHVNPSMVWSNDGQTYASAKDNARSLYADSLAPDLRMIADKINHRLLPMIGAPENEYTEFDLQAKLNGSFEEQAAQLYSAVGTPYMMASEARARLNLPFIEGTDTLARPLNTAYADWEDVPAETELAYEPETKDAPVKARGTAKTTDALEIASAMRKFFKRQGKSVVSRIDSAKDRGVLAKAEGDEDPEWWDGERWDRELAEDLEPILFSQATRRGRAAMRRIGLDASDFDDDRIRNYIAAMALGKAQAANAVTLRQLRAALDGDIGEDAEGATPQGVFEKAEESRADTAGGSFATAVAGFAVMEAGRQGAAGRRKTKTWIVTSGNPRPEHAAMDGETVDFDEEFSNGAKFPGDQALTPDESCGCMCEVEITIY